MNFIKTIRSQRKSELEILTAQEKRKFYLEELFEDHKHIKKYLIVIMLLFIASQLSSILNYSRGTTNMELSLKWTAFSSVIISAITFSLSFFIRFQQGSPKSIIIQRILLLLANLLTSCSILCRVYLFVHQAVQSPDLEAVTEGISISVSSIFAVKLTDLINPFWYLKPIIPIAYFIAWIICSFQIKTQSTYQIWISCIIGIVNIIIIYAVSASFRWNLFVKRIDNETWTAIHKIILNKVLSPILVLSTNGEITYANPEFQNLSQGDVEAFTHKLRGLKRRKTYRNNNEEEEEEEHEREEGNPSYLNVEDIKSKGTLTKTPSDGTKRLSLLNQSKTYGEIQDLAALLQIAQELLKKAEIRDTDYFIFDGKLVEHESDNEHQSFEVTLSFMVEYQKIILILRNTTDHAQLVTLENNNQYKDKLLASVSHELRTPLNGNLSLIEATINHPEVPSSLKEQFLVPAHRSGKLLLHLINDILDYSQIGAKKLRLNFECLSIVDTIKSCHQLLDLQAKKKGIDLKLFIDESLSLFTTDHDRVRQIILNLLSNALKFTFSGNISLSGELISPFQLKITVQDTGIGIKAEDLKKLFKEFTRLEGPDQVNMNAKGVGLGLTIANKLAKRLGYGTNQPGIQVESVYGQGSSFYFIIMDKKLDKRFFKYQSEREIFNKALTRSQRKEILDDSVGDLSMSQILSDDETKIQYVAKYKTEPFMGFMPRVSTESVTVNTPDTGRELLVRKETGVKKKVLIVDDEPFNILAIESYLKAYNFYIETAFNGKEAIDKVTKLSQTNDSYDLILMDCQMPIMDGFEATRILRDMMERNETKDTPIIGCTAFNSREAVKLCYGVGMAQVLEKPLSRAKMNHIISAFLDFENQ